MRSYSARLPEADRHAARSESESQGRKVLPLIVVIEIGAARMVRGEAQGAMRVGRHLPADTEVGRIVSVSSDYVADRFRVIVRTRTGDGPPAQTAIGVTGADIRAGGSQE